MALDRTKYKWFYDHIHSRYYNILIKWLFLPFGGETRCRGELLAPVRFLPDERILDMCCGTGGATYSITKQAAKGSRIVGIDLSSGQIRVARRRSELGEVQLLEGDAGCTAFRDRAFDKVFITHALHEMPRTGRKAVLAEARRTLRDNGTVIVLELDNPGNVLVRLLMGFWFFYWLPFNFETPTRRDMLEHGLVTELGEAGFAHITKTSKYRGVFQVLQGVK
ncbi:MAG: methyltransferase domain-containing protein [Gemmatimonadales bacterium]|nr:methyltransferase domain-containing protein [Gemmatimonadales bacterium]NIN12607.1 methyltransferase domain-containing protein [Gemmatimonadales bacterium]NIR02400.1 methyltransferase domain-containing protein [Gemmatimonadales bacterium]NIS66191.1 methyltransferase domain-containing protein [Gemmatimonadales bacterium]